MRENARCFYFEKLSTYEGLFSDNPNDPGGMTYKGISVKAHPELAERIAAQDLSDEEVLNIFIQKYWLKCCADELFTGLDVSVADCCYNAGPRTAVKLLQTTLNTIVGTAGNNTDLLSVDGKIGSKTKNVVVGASSSNWFNRRAEMIYHYNTLRLEFNAGLVKKKIWIPAIYYGVSNRILDLIKYSIKLSKEVRW